MERKFHLHWYFKSITKHILCALAELVLQIWCLFQKRSSPEFSQVSLFILFLRQLGTGDLIMLSPFLRALDESSKFKKIYLVSEHPPLFIFKQIQLIHPDQLSVYQSELAAGMVLSPTLSLRHWRFVFRAKYILGYFATRRLVCSWRYSIKNIYEARTAHYFERVKPLFELLRLPTHIYYPEFITEPTDLPPGPYVIVVGYSAWVEREIPLTQALAYCREQLRRNKYILLLGDKRPGEELYNEKLALQLADPRVYNWTGRLNLSQIMTAIRQCQHFYGNDTGLTHAAYLLAPQVTAVFGAVLPETRIPLLPERQKIIQTYDGRKYCEHYPCYDGLNRPSCRLNVKCLNYLKAETQA